MGLSSAGRQRSYSFNRETANMYARSSRTVEQGLFAETDQLNVTIETFANVPMIINEGANGLKVSGGKSRYQGV